MRIENFILSVVKKIEDVYPGVIAFAHKDWNTPRSFIWWWICITDLEIYLHDKRFQKLKHAWYVAGKARGVNMVFCYCSAKEKKLNKLADENNLIMNI